MPVKFKGKPVKFKRKKVRRDTPGRPPKTIPKGQYDEAGFFKAVRGWFTPKDIQTLCRAYENAVGGLARERWLVS